MSQYSLNLTSAVSAEFLSLSIERGLTHPETMDAEYVTQCLAHRQQGLIIPVVGSIQSEDSQEQGPLSFVSVAGWVSQKQALRQS